MASLASCQIVNESHVRILRKLPCEVVRETLKVHGGRGSHSLSIVFVTEERMQELNGSYNKKKTPTDVLSFPSSESDDAVYLGEIVLCPVFIRKNLSETKSFQWEISHLVAHGTLHLLGIHHEHSDKAYKEVHAMETSIITKIFKK